MEETKWMQKATIYHGNPLGLSCSRKFLLPLLKVPTFVETVEMIYCQVEHQTSWNSSIDSLNTSGASQHCWCFSTLLVLLNTAGASQYCWCFSILWMLLNTAGASQHYLCFYTQLGTFKATCNSVLLLFQKILIISKTYRSLPWYFWSFSILMFFLNTAWASQQCWCFSKLLGLLNTAQHYQYWWCLFF